MNADKEFDSNRRPEWFKTQVQIGIDQIAQGEFIEEEEMDARIERMLGS